MENVINRNGAKLVSNKKDYFEWTSKSSYMSQKMFSSDSVAIRKSKVTSTLNKPAYWDIRFVMCMCILGLSKVLMHEFHYDKIKNKYGNKSRLLSTVTDSLVCKIKT